MKSILASLNVASLDDSQSLDPELERIIETAAGLLQAGEPLDVEAMAVAHPEYADQLRKLLPMMTSLVGLQDFATDTSADVIVNGRPAPLPHKELGDFRLVRELGRGGMGTVFEAEQLSMGRRVALKVLPFAALAHDKSLQRFRNEVRAAAALDHPHIVSVYSVGEERGVHYYAMQLIRGQTLADTIAELRNSGRVPGDRQLGDSRQVDSPTIDSPVDPPPSTKPDAQVRISTAVDSRRAAEFYRSAARLGIQAAEALQHAHDQGVLHRDIKPSNLMLDADGKLYVTDFGLARIEADAGMTMTGDIVGTLRYMAPEQALAKRVVIDHRADVYSLGATLYELLTLQPAFGETDRSELLKQIAFEEPAPLRKVDRHVPAELETIVLKAMAKTPEERFPTAQHLADDLRAFLEDKPIKAKPRSMWLRTVKWCRRHRTIVASAALSVAALVFFSLIVLVSSNLAITRERNEKVAALERAERNYKHALAAVDRLLARVGNQSLAEIPQLDQLRKDVLEDTLEFYGKFLKENPKDRDVQFNTAATYTRVAMMHHDFNQYGDATRCRDKAIAILEELHALDLTNEMYRKELATSLCQRGWLSGGAKYHRRAVDLYQGLVDEFPDNDSYRYELAISLVSHASHFLGDFPEIGDSRADAVEVRPIVERAFQVANSPPYDARALAHAYCCFAKLEVCEGRLDEAERKFLEAIRLFRLAIDEHPTEGRSREHLVRDCNELGNLLEQRGELPEAEHWYREALDAGESLRRDFPGMNNFDNFAGEALKRLVRVLKAQGRTSEAMAILAKFPMADVGDPQNRARLQEEERSRGG